MNGFHLWNNGEDDDIRVGHVVKDAYFADPDSELWMSQIPQPFDATLTLFPRFVSQMDANRIASRRLLSSVQSSEILNRILSKNDSIGHIGIVAYCWPHYNELFRIGLLCRRPIAPLKYGTS